MRKTLRALLGGALLLGGLGAFWLHRQMYPPVHFATFNSGEIAARGEPPKALTTQQLGVISNWLVQHQTGWMIYVATPPVGDIDLYLKQSDGAMLSLSIFLNDTHKEKLSNPSIMMAQESPGHTLILNQSFSLEEISALQNLMPTGQPKPLQLP